MTFGTARPFTIAARWVLPLAAIAIVSPVRAQVTAAEAEPAQTPSDLRPLASSDSIMNLERARRAMSEGLTAFQDGDEDLALEKLREARQISNQLSDFHGFLSAEFEGIDNEIYSENRSRARNAAQVRDEASYQLALLHRSRNQPELAVPLLIEVIGSQNPTRALGCQAYRELYELGFADTPFPRSDDRDCPRPN